MRKMRAAAHLKARNKTWDVIATVLHYRNEHSARRALAEPYPELWREQLMLASEEYLRDDVESFAVDGQKEMAVFQDSKDPVGAGKIRQSAFHSLLAHVAKLKAQRMEIGIKRVAEEADEELMRTLIEASNVAAREIAARRIAPEAVPVTLIEAAAVIRPEKGERDAKAIGMDEQQGER